MKSFGIRLKTVAAIFVFSVLTACGGGGTPQNLSPITSFTSSSSAITAGSSAVLSPVFTSDATATIDNGVGAISSGASYTVSPTVTTTYTLTAFKTDGSSFTSSLTVTVFPAPTLTSYTASSSTITSGQSVTLTAIFANGTGVINNGVGTVQSGVGVTVSPTITTTYSLVVTNAAGAAFSSPKTITVEPVLDNLSISNETLDQTFQSAQTSYTATVSYLTKDIQLNATSVDSDAVIKVNGVTVEADGNSKSLPLTENASTAISITITKNGETKTYTLTVTREAIADFAQQAYLKASNGDDLDQFGNSLSLYGDLLAIGAAIESSNATGINGDQTNNSASVAGAVYIFKRTGTTWTQQAYLKASNAEADDGFGYRVSLYENTLAVGAYGEDSSSINTPNDNSKSLSGAVYIFTLNNNTWSQQAYLKASNPDVDDRFSISISLHKDTLAVGAVFESSDAIGINGDETNNNRASSGAVYVFKRSGTSWAQEAYIKSSNSANSDLFGYKVSVHGDTLAASAVYEDSNAIGVNGNQNDNSNYASGAVYIFTRSGSTWTQQAYLKASNNTGSANDEFGASLSLFNDTLAVGATGEDSNATGINGNQSDISASSSGAVYVFTRNGTTWSQEAYIKASNTDTGDLFGSQVSLYGNMLAVGAYGEDSASAGINGDQTNNTVLDTGAVYVFARSGTTWSQTLYVKASNPAWRDVFGGWHSGLSLSQSTLVSSSPKEDGGGTDRGAAYVFK